MKMTDDFKSFESIQPIGKLFMRITQKIHGSNAQIKIDKTDSSFVLRTGSRNRWIMPHDDNFGFSKHVYDHAEQFLALGEGIHYGEWAGPGINSGEGLTEKTFFLFSHPRRYEGIILPPNVKFVPELFVGPVSMDTIDLVMNNLLEQGSQAVPGFMNPEGIVIEIDGKRYKKTFAPEESKWCGVKKVFTPRVYEDFSHLCQPLRLEKLLSKDERFIREFPESLPEIVKAYMIDLVKDEQITGSLDEQADIRKRASRNIFSFVKEVMKNV